ncbi:MAG: FG-GAP-like repeat-containing protein [Melioribacteraceae bacterium]|nr:FG-GAP-like repeat-containing protein [Melioribacteraceae bacterium]
MKKTLVVLLFLFGATSILAQYKSIATYTRDSTGYTNPDAPWNTVVKDNYGHIRSVLITDDLDGDGKAEILATDYSGGGRIHAFEYAGNGVLEMVWSSPLGLGENHLRSTPRWVQTGDLDGDGKKEIIFAVGTKSTSKLQVFENVGDNDYGTQSIIEFPSDQFSSLGLGNFNAEGERGTVSDFDGDGTSELIWRNDDKKVYILSISGNAPGFASWQIEGGDPNVDPMNWAPGGTFYHSVPADIDGDGIIEIVNHNFDNLAFWSIDVEGTNSYSYSADGNPDGGKLGPYYYGFLENDAVSLMGLAVADVDGDNKDEIACITGYSGDYRYGVGLINIGQGETGLNVWDNANKFTQLANRWDIGKADSSSQFWGIHSADLNQNGNDEILVGGFYGENVVSIEFSGTGDITDLTNYEIKVLYSGETLDNTEWITITISDSVGVIDTQYSKDAWQNPGVMKMSDGDITGDGKLELALAYQIDYADSTDIIHKSWNGSSWDETTETIARKYSIPLRILQYDIDTGVRELNLNIITPDDYVLEQNYPNPFNPSTNIRFSLPISKKITVKIYDMLGSEVKTLVDNEAFTKGSYEATWDGTNNFGSKVASGNYIATMKFGNFSKSIKMQLLK